MMIDPLLDLYSDYLIYSFSYTTATGLSAALDGSISHDKVTRFLSNHEPNNRELWKQIKPLVRQIETPDGVLVIDNSIIHKPYTDQNDLVTYHFDHTVGRNVKGINLVSTLYVAERGNIPLCLDPIKKPTKYIDEKTGRERRKADVQVNDLVRENLTILTHNKQVKYQYVLADIWFACKETMTHIKQKLKKDFIMPLKHNRLVRINQESPFQALSSLPMTPGTVTKIYLKSLSFPVLFSKIIFTNEDQSTGELYLVSSDLTLTSDSILKLYKKRWSIEEYHRTLKSYVGVAKSPTKTVTTQVSHLFASVHAYLKLERLKMATKLNHTALKTKLYVKALQTSMAELKQLQSNQNYNFAQLTTSA